MTTERKAFALLNAVADADLILGPERAVLYAMALRADGDTGANCYPSMTLLASMTGLTERTVRRAVQSLRDVYEVIVHVADRAGRAGGKPVKVWSIRFDRLAVWSSANEDASATAFRGSKFPNRSERPVPIGRRDRFQPVGATDDLPLDLPVDLPQGKEGARSCAVLARAVSLIVDAHDEGYNHDDPAMVRSIPPRFFVEDDDYSTDAAAERMLLAAADAVVDYGINDGVAYICTPHALALSPQQFIVRVNTALFDPARFTRSAS